jgi:hypothetical protein
VTNEEIERKFEDRANGDYKRIHLDLARELVVQAYEEAAKKLCSHCQQGKRAFPGGATVSFETGHSGASWFHNVHGASVGCRASTIHDLRNSLLAVAV